MLRWYARLFVYGSAPFRFLWVFFAEQKLAIDMAWIEVRYPESQVDRVIKLAEIRREKRRTRGAGE